jgi:hypothetical protein
MPGAAVALSAATVSSAVPLDGGKHRIRRQDARSGGRDGHRWQDSSTGHEGAAVQAW